MCHTCWLRTKREALRSNRLDGARFQTASVEVLPDHQPLGQNESENMVNVQTISEHDLQRLPGNEPVSNESAVNEPAANEPAANEPALDNVNTQNVVIPDYRRAANSNHRCVFPNCHSTRLHSISDKLRAIVLNNHKFYLPNLARVCGQHLMSNSWEILYDSENSLETFTTEHIRHVFSFVNAFIPTIKIIFKKWKIPFSNTGLGLQKLDSIA